MNWDAMGAIGELVGGVAVIASLVYLAVQIRNNTRVSASEAYREGASIWAEVFRMFADTDNELVMRALIHYETLDSHEKHTFDTLMITLLNALESNLAGIGGGLLFDEVNSAVEGYIRRYFAYEGTLAWWRDGRSGCAPVVQEWIDERFPAPDPDYDIWGIRGPRLG